jgi:hypothetical protein
VERTRKNLNAKAHGCEIDPLIEPVDQPEQAQQAPRQTLPLLLHQDRADHREDDESQAVEEVDVVHLALEEFDHRRSAHRPWILRRFLVDDNGREGGSGFTAPAIASLLSRGRTISSLPHPTRRMKTMHIVGGIAVGAGFLGLALGAPGTCPPGEVAVAAQTPAIESERPAIDRAAPSKTERAVFALG